MIKKITLLLLFFVGLNSIAQKSFIKTYEGKINKEMSIYVRLVSNSGEITGKLLGIDGCNEYKLTGKIENNKIQLQATTVYKDKDSELFFYGNFSEKNKITGTLDVVTGTTKVYKSFFLIETKESFNQFIKNCNETIKKKETVVITKVTILSIPATKPSGRAWDNMFGNYKPDIYLELSNNGEVIYNQKTMLKDVDHTKMPVILIDKPIKITKENYSKDFTVALYDLDTATAHDLIGGFIIPVGNKKLYSNDKRSVTLDDKKGLRVRINYHYE